MGRARYEAMLVWRMPNSGSAPTFTVLDPVLQLDKISWSNELVGEGSITLAMNPDRQSETVKAYLRDIGNDPVEIWLYRDGNMVQAGPVIGVQTQSATVNLIARGLQYYLRYMFVTSNLDYSAGVDQYTISKNLVNHWQSKTYGNFGIDTSSIGTSGYTRKIKYSADEYPNVLQAIENLAEQLDGFEFYIRPYQRDLVLVGQRGSDKTGTVILDSRAIPKANAHFSTAAGDFATDAYIAGSQQDGDEVFLGSYADAAGIARWGRAGITLSVDGIESQLLADNYAQTSLEAVNRQRFVPQVGTVWPVLGADVLDFDVGDKVTWVYDYSLGMIETTRDVYKKFVSANSEGEESMTVEFL